MMAGPAAFICNECIELLVIEVLAKDHPNWVTELVRKLQGPAAEEKPDQAKENRAARHDPEITKDEAAN
jgi:hypothetical protein